MSDTSFEAMNSLEERVSVFYDENYSDGFIHGVEYDQISEDDDEDLIDSEERALYWESQHSLLQEVLERYCSVGSKMRKEVSRTIDAARESTFINGCHCLKPKSDGCNHCLRQQVVDRLRDKGITATLCTSKWKDTKNFPRGSHEYIELIGNTMNRKKRVTFMVEVEFRDQFEIAKACKEYRKLVSDLPEYYVGKPEYLQTVVRLVCEAAKASLKERRIHMGPWRKASFMLMKWSANSSPRDDSALTLTDSSDDVLRPYSQFAVVAT